MKILHKKGEFLDIENENDLEKGRELEIKIEEKKSLLSLCKWVDPLS